MVQVFIKVVWDRKVKIFIKGQISLMHLDAKSVGKKKIGLVLILNEGKTTWNSALNKM